MFCTSCDCQAHRLTYVNGRKLCDQCLEEWRYLRDLSEWRMSPDYVEEGGPF